LILDKYPLIFKSDNVIEFTNSLSNFFTAKIYKIKIKISINLPNNKPIKNKKKAFFLIKLL